MLSRLEAFIIGVTLEATLAGVYFASFLLCLRWLIFSDDGGTLRKTSHRPFLIITLILFSFTVTALAIGLQKVLTVSHDASAMVIPTTITNINFFLEMSGLIITDGVLIFRCWTVYNRSWRIAILPLLLFLFNISSLLVTTYWSTSYELTGNDSSNGMGAMMASYYAANIVINIYTTSAIIHRIRRNSLSRRFARSAIHVIAKSGLLYTLTSFATFWTMVIRDSPEVAYIIASAINYRTAGIAFNLILIRVAKNRANRETELPAFISTLTIERAMPAGPRHNLETVTVVEST